MCLILEKTLELNIFIYKYTCEWNDFLSLSLSLVNPNQRTESKLRWSVWSLSSLLSVLRKYVCGKGGVRRTLFVVVASKQQHKHQPEEEKKKLYFGKRPSVVCVEAVDFSNIYKINLLILSSLVIRSVQTAVFIHFSCESSSINLSV